MIKQEFFKIWSVEELKKYHILFHENNRLEFTIFCWETENGWRIEEYEERGYNEVIMVGSESEIFEEMNKIAERKKTLYENMPE